MKHDDFGDRMKAYERVYTDTRISVDEVLCVRIDGKNFSNYTKNFVKPFDSNLSDVMIQTTKDLIEESEELDLLASLACYYGLQPSDS
jgi:tRNA(His) 5'-end guanylyltransferase